MRHPGWVTSILRYGQLTLGGSCEFNFRWAHTRGSVPRFVFGSGFHCINTNRQHPLKMPLSPVSGLQAPNQAEGSGPEGFEPYRVCFPGPEIVLRVLADSNPWSCPLVSERGIKTPTSAATDFRRPRPEAHANREMAGK